MTAPHMDRDEPRAKLGLETQFDRDVAEDMKASAYRLRFWRVYWTTRWQGGWRPWRR